MIEKRSAYVLVFLVVCLAVGGFVVYRNARMTSFFQTALSPLSSTATAHEAIRALSRYDGSAATSLLVRIATNDQAFIDDRQIVAIEAVAQRKDPSALARLAFLLQPHVELGRRKAVAKTLEQGVCVEECIERILHYEERLWHGDVSDEDTAGITDHLVLLQIAKEHALLIESLNQTLVHNQRMTVSVLRNIYGLGSPVPSAFALHVVETTRMRGACPLISGSGRSDLISEVQREKLFTLAKDLNCSSNP
jgi:hypothetical protein